MTTLTKKLKTALVTIAASCSLFASAEYKFIQPINIEMVMEPTPSSFQSRQLVSNVGLGSNINGVNVDPDVFFELIDYPINTVIDSSSNSQFFDSITSTTTVPIKNITIGSTTADKLIIRYEGSESAPDLLTGSAELSISHLSNEEVHVIKLNQLAFNSSDIINQPTVMEMNNVAVQFMNESLDTVGSMIADTESTQKTQNSNLSSIVYDSTLNQLVVTYSALEDSSSLGYAYDANYNDYATNPLWINYTVQ